MSDEQKLIISCEEKCRRTPQSIQNEAKCIQRCNPPVVKPDRPRNLCNDCYRKCSMIMQPESSTRRCEEGCRNNECRENFTVPSRYIGVL